MKENTKYMTVAECKLYRELAAQQDALVPGMSMSFPCGIFVKDDFRKASRKTVNKKRTNRKTCKTAIGF